MTMQANVIRYEDLGAVRFARELKRMLYQNEVSKVSYKDYIPEANVNTWDKVKNAIDSYLDFIHSEFNINFERIDEPEVIKEIHKIKSEHRMFVFMDFEERLAKDAITHVTLKRGKVKMMDSEIVYLIFNNYDKGEYVLAFSTYKPIIFGNIYVFLEELMKNNRKDLY